MRSLRKSGGEISEIICWDLWSDEKPQVRKLYLSSALDVKEKLTIEDQSLQRVEKGCCKALRRLVRLEQGG